jgi:hypothetical protein
MIHSMIGRAVGVCVMVSTLGLAGCASSGGSSAEALTRDRLAMLEDWMTGSFSSARQSAQDADFLDIRLRMCRIWAERADGPWLYVEQATAAAMDKPYRQRVYHLIATGPQTFVSSVYEIPEPLRFAGACGGERPLADLTPESLAARDGCAVHLTFHPCSEMFAGATEGRGCSSTLRGASYATSEVSITQHGIVSWDRGFDASGTQVWGAEKGGYRFVRDGVKAR